MRAWTRVISTRLTWAVLILGSTLAKERSARAEEEVRIAILADRPKIDVGGANLLVFDADTGDRLFSWTGDVSTSVSLRRGRIRLGDKELGKTRRLFIEAKGGVRAGSGIYLGRLELDIEPGGLIAINRLPLETYLLGIVGSEMSPEWPLEALKAQAVAARTYALQRRMMMRAANKPYDLESSVISQVYKGAERIRPSVIQAVKETRGEVMSYRHGLAEALFHSTCGGKTSSAQSTFGRSIPYLVSEPCRWCRDSARHRWHLEVPIKELAAMLDRSQKGVAKIQRVDRTPGATLVHLRTKAGERSVSPKQMRQAMGYGVLFSEHFTAKTTGAVVHIDGSGFGHGVGMCQWGARGLALEGKTHAEILQYYYRGIRVQRIY